VDAAAPEAAGWAACELLVRNYDPPATAEEHGTLRPWEARVYKRTA
jgi:hypothetical protein